MSEKYEWSDSGKKLLKTIINEIKEMGGMKPAYHIIKTESSPVYSHKAAAKKFFYERYKKARRDKAIKAKTFLIKHPFTDEELHILNSNLDLSPTDLSKLLPHRTYDCVKAMRNNMKNKLLIIKMLV